MAFGARFGTRFLFLLSAVATCVLGQACVIDTAPDGLRATPAGNGPVVKFDTSHRPLPEVPLPNDVATFADPTSRTGRRVNVSLVAPTRMEQQARSDFQTLEGWGVTAPISVSFARPEGADPREAAIDLEDVASRMQGDEWDLSNDPVYLVNLTTGLPVFVDAGNGLYPITVRDPHRYFPNDPKVAENNLSFETQEEAAGFPQSYYRPELDKDFDGVLDHPNALGTRGIPGVDNIMTWYERETDTLILRPAIPLDEKTEYAIVLTDRLRGYNRQPVKSPFSAIHHPAQRRGIGRLQDILGDKGRTSYFGDIAGTGLEHVSFAWTFTTQPTHEDMRLLRDGIYGKGPFARFKDIAPSEVVGKQIAGNRPYDEGQDPGWQNSTPACQKRAARPYIMKVNDPDIRESFRSIFGEVFSFSAGELKSLEASFEYIDHVVVGSFTTPFLLGDPKSTDPDTRFHLDFKTGEGDVRATSAGFLLIVPKTTATRKPPFPVAFWGHGVGGNTTEPLQYAGDYARQGIALIAYNNPEHGIAFPEFERSLAIGTFTKNCLVPFIGAIEVDRARDVTGDGFADSAAYWWSAHVFHTRDNVRQGILDGMQLLKGLREFDGRVGKVDYDGDGKPDLAGDFDVDGIPDVGGPNVQYYAAGESLGGIMSQIQGGIEPHMIASVPMSGGASLAMDVAMRSYGVVESVTSQMMGPVVVSVLGKERTNEKSKEEMKSRCAPEDRSVRIVVNNATENYEMEIACLNATDLDLGMTVIVTNVTTGEARCARTDKDGKFRTPIPTSAGDKLDIQVYKKPDVVVSYEGCQLADPNAPVGRRINTWEQSATMTLDVKDPSKKCDAPEGCAQFRDQFYPVGSTLVAVNEGLGLRRQSPPLRRFRDLAQIAFDLADPAVYAPYYMLKPLFDENGNKVPPHGLLNINTVGDNFVQIGSGLSFSRASGALPFLPPNAIAKYPEYGDYVTPQEIYDRLGRKTPMQFFIDNGVVEGIARLGRTRAGRSCKANYQKNALCTKDEEIPAERCLTALYDADWVSEGRLPFDQPHPAPEATPRLARLANVRVTDAASLAAAWEPRLRGVPQAPDETAWSARDRVVGVLNHYLTPEGKHTWDTPDACRVWDFAVYGNNLTARFFATEGRDLYYLSHPRTHGCLVDATCDFFKP